MPVGMKCIICGRIDRPVMAWKGEEVCSEGCRKARDEDGEGFSASALGLSPVPIQGVQVAPPVVRPEPKNALEPYWRKDIRGVPVRHWPCEVPLRDITEPGDEVEWFECPACQSKGSGRRLYNETGSGGA